MLCASGHFLTIENFMKISLLRLFGGGEGAENCPKNKYYMKAKYAYLLLSLINIFRQLLKIRSFEYFVYLEMAL